MAFNNINVLSKLQIDNVLYSLKDAEVRSEFTKLLDELKTAAYKEVVESVTGSVNLPTDAAVKAYVDAQVGSINKFDVVVNNAGSTDGPSVIASAETMYKLYLVPYNEASADTYIEWITVNETEGYRWEKIGSTAVNLTGYVLKTLTIAGIDLADNISVTELQDALGLGDLAYKNSAVGSINVVTGLTAAKYTPAGDVTVTLDQTPTNIASTGKFTPAGNVTGTAKVNGSIDVTLSQTATAAELTKGDYTPAGQVSVALSGGSFNAITSVGTAASFTEGEFTPASLTYADSDAFAKEGLIGSVSGETLTLTTASTGKASVISAFSGGSKTADTFVPNTPATMKTHNVGVQSASFTGTTAKNALVTGVSYNKAAVATQKFTGDTVDISATFAGTEGDIAVSGKYNQASVKSTGFTGTAAQITPALTKSDVKVTVS